MVFTVYRASSLFLHGLHQKNFFEVLTQHLSSAFVSSVALQISRDALGRNAGDLLQTLQHWSYEEEKPLDLHQFFSFCLVRTAGSWTPSSDLTQNRHLTCEILSTNAHIHMNALKIRQIIRTTFSFLFAASVCFLKKEKFKCQIQGFEWVIWWGAKCKCIPALY